jgi:uncharacterized coiled-coil DUF342 family protein
MTASHTVEAAAQRAVENHSRLGQLESEIADIDRKIEALQEERRTKRNEQRSIMQKAITKALQGGA